MIYHCGLDVKIVHQLSNNHHNPEAIHWKVLSPRLTNLVKVRETDSNAKYTTHIWSCTHCLVHLNAPMSRSWVKEHLYSKQVTLVATAFPDHSHPLTVATTSTAHVKDSILWVASRALIRLESLGICTNFGMTRCLSVFTVLVRSDMD